MPEEITLVEAGRLAVLQEMRRDPTVWVLGEDVGRGGLWGQYRGMLEEFGATRIVSTPIAESTIMGAGLGAALVGTGCRVAPDARVERSVLWDRVTVEAGAMLRECVVTDGVRVPGDTSWHGVSLRIADGSLQPGEREYEGLAIATL